MRTVLLSMPRAVIGSLRHSHETLKLPFPDISLSRACIFRRPGGEQATAARGIITSYVEATSSVGTTPNTVTGIANNAG